MVDPFAFMACCSTFMMLLGAFTPERFGFTQRYVAMLLGGIALVFTLALRAFALSGGSW